MTTVNSDNSTPNAVKSPTHHKYRKVIMVFISLAIVLTLMVSVLSYLIISGKSRVRIAENNFVDYFNVLALSNNINNAIKSKDNSPNKTLRLTQDQVNSLLNILQGKSLKSEIEKFLLHNSSEAAEILSQMERTKVDFVNGVFRVDYQIDLTTERRITAKIDLRPLITPKTLEVEITAFKLGNLPLPPYLIQWWLDEKIQEVQTSEYFPLLRQVVPSGRIDKRNDVELILNLDALKTVSDKFKEQNNNLK